MEFVEDSMVRGNQKEAQMAVRVAEKFIFDGAEKQPPLYYIVSSLCEEDKPKQPQQQPQKQEQQQEPQRPQQQPQHQQQQQLQHQQQQKQQQEPKRQQQQPQQGPQRQQQEPQRQQHYKFDYAEPTRLFSEL